MVRMKEPPYWVRPQVQPGECPSLNSDQEQLFGIEDKPWYLSQFKPLSFQWLPSCSSVPSTGVTDAQPPCNALYRCNTWEIPKILEFSSFCQESEVWRGETTRLNDLKRLGSLLLEAWLELRKWLILLSLPWEAVENCGAVTAAGV